jgi:murein DD-endopeptidase MepM/ murein hydrolase activator NlpD
MKRTLSFLLIVISVIMFFHIEQCNAFKRHGNGWAYPMDRTPTSSEWNSWHSYTGHVGHDYIQNVNLPVRAVADGEIVDYDSSLSFYGGPSSSDKGGAILLRHKTSDNIVFYAVYGHNYIKSGLSIGSPVKAGDVIGYTHNFIGAEHIHFGIHPYAIDESAHFRGFSTDGSDHGWVDPKDFLDNNAPYVDFSNNSQMIEATVRKVGDAAWYPPNVDCFDAQKWFRVTSTTCYFADRTICFEIMGACPAF